MNANAPDHLPAAPIFLVALRAAKILALFIFAVCVTLAFVQASSRFVETNNRFVSSWFVGRDRNFSGPIFNILHLTWNLENR